MESVVAALVTGVLVLAGVLVSNSRSRAVMEAKNDNLARQAEGHNRMVERLRPGAGRRRREGGD